MTIRPVFHGLLGAELREVRESRGWTQGQVVDFVRRRRLPAVSIQQLRYLEEGRTRHPEAGTLRAVAALYAFSYEDLVARFVAANYQVAGETRRSLAPLAGLWRLVDKVESKALDAWRRASAAGRQSAMAVLSVSKTEAPRRASLRAVPRSRRA